jgi:hypothetical protein
VLTKNADDVGSTETFNSRGCSWALSSVRSIKSLQAAGLGAWVTTIFVQPFEIARLRDHARGVIGAIAVTPRTLEFMSNSGADCYRALATGMSELSPH